MLIWVSQQQTRKKIPKDACFGIFWWAGTSRNKNGNLTELLQITFADVWIFPVCAIALSVGGFYQINWVIESFSTQRIAVVLPIRYLEGRYNAIWFNLSSFFNSCKRAPLLRISIYYYLKDPAFSDCCKFPRRAGNCFQIVIANRWHKPRVAEHPAGWSGGSILRLLKTFKGVSNAALGPIARW